MTLSLRAMRYTLAAIRHESISAAAAAMHVAPSAIATALAQAEAVFGMALVTRARSKGIFPTAAGRDVQRRIEDLLERYDTLIADVSDLKSGATGTLTIGYNAPIAPAFLPPIAKRLRDVYPDVSLSFVEGNNTTVRAGMIDGQFDAIIFVEDVPSPQIETRPMIFAPTYCLCPADHPLAAKPSVSVFDIVREPLILLDRPAARSYYIELLTECGEPFQIAATANSTEMVRSLVGAGLGISLLNMRPRDIPAYSGNELRCIPIAGAKSGVQLSLGFAPGPARLLTQQFVEICTAFFEGTDGLDFVVPAEEAGQIECL